MIREEIEQLAEKEAMTVEIGNGRIRAYISFINGYTTCQQTEVAELKKKLERAIELLHDIYIECMDFDGHGAKESETRWEQFKQQNNL
jgi:hypothetical protein